MVAKHFINGGNTSSALNWSLSSGGPNDTGVPTSADDIFFDQNINSTVDSVLTCLNIQYAVTNSMNVNADIEVHGNVWQSGNGNWQQGGGVVRCRGNVSVLGGGCQANFEFIGDDTTLTLGTNMKIGLPTLNKNVGKKLTITQTAHLNSFFSDWILEEGILDLGAFNLSSIGDFTQNGGAVTSTTGLLQAPKFFLNDGVFDPFKAISSTSSTSVLFTDSATLNLMPSGGDFEFIGSNHWLIDQNFTVFPHFVINKCTTCNQTGQWYAQDVTLKNNTSWGTGFIRGDVLNDAVGYNSSSGVSQTFDGVGVQEVNGNVRFSKLIFNKISGSLKLNDDFRLSRCEVFAGADLIDFGTSLCHILATGSHLNLPGDWEVLGLKFYDLELEIASSGGAKMKNTNCHDFVITQCATLSGSFEISGKYENNDSSLSVTATAILNGDSDQTIFTAAGGGSGDVELTINKPSGSAIQLSNVGNATTDLTIVNGIWCTNDFDLDTDSILIVEGAELQKTTNSNVTYNTLSGVIRDVAECSGKKNSFFLAV